MFNYRLKKISVLMLVGGFLMLSFSFPVFAEETTNSETGAGSVNNSLEETNNQTEINNNNLTILSNEFYVRANTGGNSTSYNTGSGLITTNRAKGKGEIINIINRNQTEYNSPSDLGDLEATNETTGANSENNSQVIYSDNIVVRNINESETGNIINADINSGRNKSNYNTGHGIILSGEANLGLDIITLANTNIFGTQTVQFDTLNVFENYQGNVTFTQGLSPELVQVFALASNETTGYNSENNASVEVSQNVEIENKNIALLDNDVELNVKSGDNEANGNSGSGAVSSGDVNVAFNMINLLNANVTSSNWWFSSLNVFGSWQGDIILPQMIAQGNNGLMVSEIDSYNEQTGYNSENDATGEVENSLDVSNSNDAAIANNVQLNAQTGDNRNSFNTGSGSGEFGDAEAENNTINITNLNVTGDSWWLVIVNTFGSWSGTTIGSPSDMVVKASQNATVLSPAGSGIEAWNSSTGPNSDNNASVSVNHSTEVTNDNEAEINNDITINAVSGENETSFNTGQGYVSTGDIRAATNLINIANTNITVGNWLVAVINVFGDWIGNIRFPEGMSANSSSSGSQEISGSGSGDSSASNETTGADSENNASNTTNNNTEINNNNTAEVNNSMGSSSTSGENEANYNTGSGVVTTGEAYTEANLTNEINNNQTDVNNTGSGSDSSSASNEETGYNSENNATNETNNNTEINNNNSTTADNNFDSSTNTGSNTANYNTGDGNVDSGVASTILELVNEINGNEASVSTGSGGSEMEAGNSTTGANSENNSSSENNNDNQVSNNNETNLENNVNIENNTGGNSADYNLGMGGVSTGDGQTSGSMENSANQNQTQTGSSGTSGDSSDSSNNSGGADSLQSGSNNSGGGGSIASGGSGGSGGGNEIAEGISNIPGDLNGDGKVDDYDFSIVMGNWGEFFKDPRADANGDGKVDDYDFSIVMGNWGMITAMACR